MWKTDLVFWLIRICTFLKMGKICTAVIQWSVSVKKDSQIDSKHQIPQLIQALQKSQTRPWYTCCCWQWCLWWHARTPPQRTTLSPTTLALTVSLMMAVWCPTVLTTLILSPSNPITMSTQTVSFYKLKSMELLSNHFFLDCSRFWECGPAGETCLFECAPCGRDNPMCNGQWALSFDVRFQYPVGPTCDWPSTINCTNGGCEDKEPRPECCSDEECNNGCPASHCSHNFQCIYDEHCDCTLDTDCDTYDGICNIPPPHTNDTCAYCSDGQCKGGKALW